jgi:hypothetical protein
MYGVAHYLHVGTYLIFVNYCEISVKVICNGIRTAYVVFRCVTKGVSLTHLTKTGVNVMVFCKKCVFL